MEHAQRMIDGLYDAAVLLDTESRIVAFNRPFARLCGRSARELKKGAGAFELIGADNGIDRQHAQRCIAERKPQHIAEQPARNAEGERLIVWFSFLPVLDESGVPVGMIEILRDVTGESASHARLKELLALTQARAEDLERAVEQRTVELRAALDEVTRLSRTDPLTGLLNRRCFNERAEHAIGLAIRHRRTLGILMCDLDHFKKLNDEHGHQAGDAMLVQVARALSGAIRGSDVLARFGGEEFIVLLSETTRDGVEEVARRCTQVVRSASAGAIDGLVRPQTVSIGAAVFPDHGETLDRLIQSADRALYESKRRGRDRFSVFDPRQRSDTHEPISLNGRTRALVVATEPRLSTIGSALSPSFEVVMTSSAKHALELARQKNFDLLIADERVHSESGIDFLRETLHEAPSAIRILSVETQDFFLAVRATNVAGVDYFLLVSDGVHKLKEAADDALARRDIRRGGLSTAIQGAAGPRADRSIEEMLEKRSLRFMYQPIVFVGDEALFAYEALCRPPPSTGLGPAELFEAATRSGQVWRLGRASRAQIAADVPRIDDRALLFVNLHPAELDDPELISREAALYPARDRVIFEITERASIPDFERARANIEALRMLGFRVAVDDLGAGYASLSSVALLEPDFIKIDMTITRGMHQARRRFDLVRRIVDYASDAGIKVIAEGIECEEESKAAAEAGCELQQGYFFARPADLP
jgi:diguanylate cyclase (GGDEF)-like protein/PAS domain S-box-containing protein